jgi:hypothetical protein
MQRMMVLREKMVEIEPTENNNDVFDTVKNIS